MHLFYIQAAPKKHNGHPSLERISLRCLQEGANLDFQLPYQRAAALNIGIPPPRIVDTLAGYSDLDF